MSDKWFNTVHIAPDAMESYIVEFTEQLNSFSRKYNPFRVVVEQEKLSVNMSSNVCRFSLAITSDFDVPERKAADFIKRIKEAAIEVEKMNEMNYIIDMPPRRAGGPMGGPHA